MCQIILTSNVKNPVAKDVFLSSAFTNPDGIGIAYPTPTGEVQVIKPYYRPGKAYEDYMQVCAESSGPVLVHFRFATHGSKGPDNVHPFLVGARGEVALAHNGILPADQVDNLSDTRFWAETVFYGRSTRQLLSPHFRAHLEPFLGTSKIVLLGPKGEYSIFNENWGSWEGTNWFSCPRRPYVWTQDDLRFPDYKFAMERDLDDELDALTIDPESLPFRNMKDEM